MSNPYTYIAVRTDLSTPQQIVQASHAAIQAGERFGAHSHIVLIEARTQQDLLSIADHLDVHGIVFEMFNEPDDNAGYTALCTKPLVGEERKALKRFRLLK